MARSSDSWLCVLAKLTRYPRCCSDPLSNVRINTRCQFDQSACKGDHFFVRETNSLPSYELLSCSIIRNDGKVFCSSHLEALIGHLPLVMLDTVSELNVLNEFALESMLYFVLTRIEQHGHFVTEWLKLVGHPDVPDEALDGEPL